MFIEIPQKYLSRKRLTLIINSFIIFIFYLSTVDKKTISLNLEKKDELKSAKKKKKPYIYIKA